MSRKQLDQESGDIEALLPWHAAGTLSAREARRVDDALAHDPDLARLYAVIREEQSATIEFNESLGAPSSRAMKKLFAAIDAEPSMEPSSTGLAARIAAFVAGLSPRTLAWSASLAGMLLVLQAGAIGAMWLEIGSPGPTSPPRMQAVAAQPAMAPQTTAPLTRNLGIVQAPAVLIRFTPDARAADITALLDRYQASIVDSVRGGFFRLQFRDGQQPAELVAKLQTENIIYAAVAAR